MRATRRSNSEGSFERLGDNLLALLGSASGKACVKLCVRDPFIHAWQDQTRVTMKSIVAASILIPSHSIASLICLRD
eukprot:4160991-Amphidinium_carterae.1